MGINKTLRNKKVLITCGPTWIPIDSIRIISNQSTGALGQSLADILSKAGSKVTLLEGPVLNPVEIKNVKKIKYRLFDDLYKIIRHELKKKYDVVIHAAAVSDYKLAKPFKEKMSSKLKKTRLDLVSTAKIIHSMKKLNPHVFLIGFKLESKLSKQNAIRKTRELFTKAKCDLVVANTLQNQNYKGYIIDQNKQVLAQRKSRTSMVKTLKRILERKL